MKKDKDKVVDNKGTLGFMLAMVDEMDEAEKNKISHRAQAAREAREVLARLGGELHSDRPL